MSEGGKGRRFRVSGCRALCVAMGLIGVVLGFCQSHGSALGAALGLCVGLLFYGLVKWVMR